MPSLVSPEETSRLQHRIEGATRGRMLREMGDAVEAVTAERALVLVIEDLHWSDHATLDLIAWLARRREPARLFVLCTYRPVDAIVRSHPLRSVVPELARHRHCEELALELLTEADVGRYLSLRFPDSGLVPGLVRAIHGHTDGNPLFMVTVVEALVQDGWLVPIEGRWEAKPGAEQAATAVPPSLAQMVEQQFDALGADDQNVLQAASVAGHEFSSAAVAGGLEQPLEAVEARCATLVRQTQFLEGRGSETWEDGTVAGRYRFVHALFRQVVHERLPAARRAQLHRKIGLRLEAAYGERAGERAGELAHHFLEGHAPERALGYLKTAAENAQGRAAYREAVNHLTQALDVLARLPTTPERARRELDLRMALGPPLMALRGFAAPEVEKTYSRARELCDEVGETAYLFPTIWGLWQWRLVRGRPASARELADQLLKLGDRDPRVTLLALVAQGLTRHYLGDLEAARIHLDRAVALYRHDEHRALALAAGQQNPAVTAHRYGAWTLWILGYPDQALHRAEATLRLAQELGHSPTMAATLIFQARLHQFLGDPARTRELADATMRLAREQGFAQRLAASGILAGWARVAGGDAEGLAVMLRGLDDFRGTGAGDDIPYWLALLAEARLIAGQAEAAARDLAEALALIHADGPRLWEPEIHRLRGEARLACGADPATVEAAFLEALTAARRHGARSHELRAATALARLWSSTGRRADAHAGLAEVYGWFTEGFASRDLTAARVLLDELSAPPSSRPARRSRAPRPAPPG
jgi:predicted ATPase